MFFPHRNETTNPWPSAIIRVWAVHTNRAVSETPRYSGGSKPDVWGGSQIGGRQEGFTCLNTKVCLRQSLGVTQKWLPFVGQKVAILVGRTMRIFREKPVRKRFISSSQKRFETGPKQWSSFFTSYTDLVYLHSTKCILKGIKACCAQAFATVLVIRSKISEEQCLKRISDLVRSRTVLLRLGSDNSCPTIGLK